MAHVTLKRAKSNLLLRICAVEASRLVVFFQGGWEALAAACWTCCSQHGLQTLLMFSIPQPHRGIVNRKRVRSTKKSVMNVSESQRCNKMKTHLEAGM